LNSKQLREAGATGRVASGVVGAQPRGGGDKSKNTGRDDGENAYVHLEGMHSRKGDLPLVFAKPVGGGRRKKGIQGKKKWGLLKGTGVSGRSGLQHEGESNARPLAEKGGKRWSNPLPKGARGNGTGKRRGLKGRGSQCPKTDHHR